MKRIETLEASLKESRAETAWEKNKLSAREAALKLPDNIFALFEAVNLSADDLSSRRIKCGWCPSTGPLRGKGCGVPAIDVLPRPAIFVCAAHLDEWNEKMRRVGVFGDVISHHNHNKRLRLPE